MGTTGDLLPGRVNLMAPLMPIPGMVNLRAGTLQALPPGTMAPTMGTSLGTYSMAIINDGSYAAAPPATPYNGPGQLLLDAAAQAAGMYLYAPGGDFGAGGLMLDGGAIGFDGPTILPMVPGVYGAPLISTLYQPAAAPPAPMPTNILHLGGEFSGPGATVVMFPIADAAFPVALIKSGNESVLDLTGVPAHPYSGGTSIAGGEVLVNAGPQLGMGAIVIGDGGILHVVAPPAPGTPVIFDQPLRVANGPLRRSSIVEVDLGELAVFTGALAVPFGTGAIEASAPGSILEKTGGGLLALTPPFFPPVAAAQTYGIKATDGIVVINHLPGGAMPATGQALFSGGAMELVGMGDPSFIPIPAAVQFAPGYGFAAISSYAGTVSELMIGDGAFFRLTGSGTSELMGTVNVAMGPMTVFKFGSSPLGGAARGTGVLSFAGGNVQFSPGPAARIPLDGAFTLELGDDVLFSGAANSTLNGNLIFNPGVPLGLTFIDGAFVTTGNARCGRTIRDRHRQHQSHAGRARDRRAHRDPGHRRRCCERRRHRRSVHRQQRVAIHRHDGRCEQQQSRHRRRQRVQHHHGHQERADVVGDRIHPGCSCAGRQQHDGRRRRHAHCRARAAKRAEHRGRRSRRTPRQSRASNESRQ
jgi:hypothetical protein